MVEGGFSVTDGQPVQATTLTLLGRRGGKSLAMAREVAKALDAGADVWMVQPGGEAVRIVEVRDAA